MTYCLSEHDLWTICTILNCIASYFFSIALYCIESQCLIELKSDCNGVNCNATVAAAYETLMCRINGYASRYISHRPQLGRCTTLLYTHSIHKQKKICVCAECKIGFQEHFLSMSKTAVLINIFMFLFLK